MMYSPSYLVNGGLWLMQRLKAGKSLQQVGSWCFTEFRIKWVDLNSKQKVNYWLSVKY